MDDDGDETSTHAAPGGREALALGCCCSVLANAAYRAGAPGERPFVDPECVVHQRVRAESG